MSEQVLLSLIMCICGNMKPKEAAITCFETYTNCAVVKDGRFLTKEEFAKKCNFTKNQESCYRD